MSRWCLHSAYFQVSTTIGVYIFSRLYSSCIEIDRNASRLTDLTCPLEAANNQSEVLRGTSQTCVRLKHRLNNARQHSAFQQFATVKSHSSWLSSSVWRSQSRPAVATSSTDAWRQLDSGMSSKSRKKKPRSLKIVKSICFICTFTSIRICGKMKVWEVFGWGLLYPQHKVAAWAVCLPSLRE